MMKKLNVLLMFAILGLFVCCAQPVQAAPCANGTLSVSGSVYVKGTPIYIVGTDLDASTAYYINITVGTTETQVGPWTSNADGDDITYIWTADNTASDPTVTIELCSPAATAVDTQDITVQNTDELVPTDMLIDIGIALLIIGIIAGIVYRKAVK